MQDEKNARVKAHRSLVQEVASAEGGEGFVHTITKLVARRGG